MWGKTLFLLREKLGALDGIGLCCSEGGVYGKSVSPLSLLVSLQLVGCRSLSISFWISEKGNGVSMGRRRVQASYSILLKSLPVKLFNRCPPSSNFLSYCSLFYPLPSIWLQSLSQLKTALLFSRPHTESFQSSSPPLHDIWSC